MEHHRERTEGDTSFATPKSNPYAISVTVRVIKKQPTPLHLDILPKNILTHSSSTKPEDLPWPKIGFMSNKNVDSAINYSSTAF